MINDKVKKQILTFGLILLAGFSTYILNLILISGLLFGLALTIPQFDKSRKEIIAITTFPIVISLLCILSLGLGLMFEFMNNSYSDQSGVIKVGVISSLFFLFIFDQYYPIENRKTAYPIIVILGLASALICDELFLDPSSKEMNIGKMIAIWELLVGFGLTVFVRFDWMKEKKSKAE